MRVGTSGLLFCATASGLAVVLEHEVTDSMEKRPFPQRREGCFHW